MELQNEVIAVQNKVLLQDEIIKMREDRIKNLEKLLIEFEAQNGFLRNEYAKLNDRLNQLLLPAPKKWWQFWRRDESRSASSSE